MTKRYYQQNGGRYGVCNASTVHHAVIEDGRVLAYASTHGFSHPMALAEALAFGKSNSGYYREDDHPQRAEAEAALVAEIESGGKPGFEWTQV